jgi:DUF4097 and DUF4098 domain-containing protein YvlB
LAGAYGYAEDTGDQTVVVPLHDRARPATIHAHLMNGGIRVRGEDRSDIAVQTNGHKEDQRPPRTDGMHRLDMGRGGLDIREENNVVTIKTDIFNQSGDLLILVPRRTSLELKSMNGGDISVENVEGEIEVENLNGAIRLKDVAGSVVAHSLNGEVVADLKSIDPSKAMSFSTMNGKIDVSLPSDLRANVSMKTDNGEILSDFEVKLDSSAKMNESGGGRQPDGTYHIHMDKTLHGTINGGGPEYKFRSFNGQIIIRKRK